jgi:predicted dehydrogenase
MDNKKTVKVGIIGCGMITQTRHAPEYADNPNAEIYGLYDADPERLNKFTALYDCRGYSTPESLINDPNIDAISVCSPNYTHAKYTIMALKAGKDVLCEKPIALDLNDSREMMKVSEETGRILMIGHNQRLLPTHRRSKEILDSGAIGRILTLQSNFKHSGPENWSANRSNTTWFFDKSRAKFGALGDLGSHKFDIIRYLLGDEVAKVNATTMTLDKRYPDGSFIDVEDNAMVLFRMASGIPGIMNVSWTNYGEEDNSTIIYGDKGVMKIFGDYTDDIVLEMRDGSTVKYAVGKIQTNTRQTKSGIIDEFIASIIEKRPPLITGRDGHNTLATIVACFNSASKGKWVDVEY